MPKKKDRYERLNEEFAKAINKEVKRKARIAKRKERQEKKSLQRSLNKNHPLHPHRKPSLWDRFKKRKS